MFYRALALVQWIPQGLFSWRMGDCSSWVQFCLCHTKLLSLGAQFLLTVMWGGGELAADPSWEGDNSHLRYLYPLPEGAPASSVVPPTHPGSTWVPHSTPPAFHITARLLCKMTFISHAIFRCVLLLNALLSKCFWPAAPAVFTALFRQNCLVLHLCTHHQ